MAARQRFDAFVGRVHAQKIDRNRGTYALVVIDHNIDDRLEALFHDGFAAYVRVCTDGDGVRYAILHLFRQRKAGALRKQLDLSLRDRGADYEIGFSSDFKRTARLAGFPARREWGTPRIDGRSRWPILRPSPLDGSTSSGGTATDGQPWLLHHGAHDPFMGSPVVAAVDTEVAEDAHSDAMDTPERSCGHDAQDTITDDSEAAATFDEAEEDVASSTDGSAYDVTRDPALTANPPCGLRFSAHDPLMGALAADAVQDDAVENIDRNANSTDGFEFVVLTTSRWPNCARSAVDHRERLSPPRPWLYDVPEILLGGTGLESVARVFL